MKKNKFIIIPIYLPRYEGSRVIISYLRKRGLDASCIYFCDMWNDSNVSEENYHLLFNKLKEVKPDVIGLSFFCLHKNIAKNIAHFCKDELDTLVVAGGVQATVEPEDTLSFADIVIRGDGETALEALLQSYSGDRQIFKEIPGAVYKDERGEIKMGLPNVYHDLDTLPFPDMDTDANFISEGKISTGYDLNSVKEFEIIGSRGCPFNCTYCSNSFLNELPDRPRVRVKSAEYLLKEIERVKKHCPNLTRIIFGDEMFLAKKSVVNKMLEEYPDRIGLPFACLFHPDVIDEKLMERLVTAGMKMGRCGIQAMSQKTRKEIYNRNTLDKDIAKIVKIFKKYNNVRLVFDLILNNPLESDEDIRKGFNFMLSLPTCFELNVHILLHLPETKLTKSFLDKGLIKKEHIEGYNLNPSKWAINVLDPGLTVDFPYGIDRFWLYLTTLISKPFIPRGLLRAFAGSKFLRCYPRILYCFAYIANILNLGLVSLNMLRNSEISLLSLLKIFFNSRTSLFKLSK